MNSWAVEISFVNEYAYNSKWNPSGLNLSSSFLKSAFTIKVNSYDLRLFTALQGRKIKIGTNELFLILIAWGKYLILVIYNSEQIYVLYCYFYMEYLYLSSVT